MAKETGCENETLTRATLMTEQQISHTRESLGCWSSTSRLPPLPAPPPISGGHKPFLRDCPPNPRLPSPPILRVALPCSHHLLSNVAWGQRAHEGAGGSKQREDGAGVGCIASTLPSLGQAPAKHKEGPCNSSRLSPGWGPQNEKARRSPSGSIQASLRLSEGKRLG